MDKKQLLEKIAPCSLMCHTCTAYKKGVICNSATTLLRYLDGIECFYKKHMPDAVESYKNFENILNKYSRGFCSGCRNGEHKGCCISGCFLIECTNEHNVDFCGECTCFPCDKAKDIFEDEVYNQWIEGNTYIKENGIEAFWEANREKPHYKAYKK